jgi:hypothetical protein
VLEEIIGNFAEKYLIRRQKMGKLAHLLVISATIVWLAGSGCVGNDASEAQNSEMSSNIAEAQNAVSAEDFDIGLTQAEINDLDADIADLNYLLENAYPTEEVKVEEVSN